MLKNQKHGNMPIALSTATPLTCSNGLVGGGGGQSARIKFSGCDLGDPIHTEIPQYSLCLFTVSQAAAT